MERKSPTQSATLYKIGTKKNGNYLKNQQK